MAKASKRPLHDFILSYVKQPMPDGVPGPASDRIEAIQGAADAAYECAIDHEAPSLSDIEAFEFFIDIGRTAQKKGLKTFVVMPEMIKRLNDLCSFQYDNGQYSDGRALGIIINAVWVFMGSSEEDAVRRLEARLRK